MNLKFYQIRSCLCPLCLYLFVPTVIVAVLVLPRGGDSWVDTTVMTYPTGCLLR